MLVTELQVEAGNEAEGEEAEDGGKEGAQHRSSTEARRVQQPTGEK